MRWLALVPLLLPACQASPRAPFDSGFEIHVIVRAEPAPSRPMRIRPVCTLDDRVRRSPPRSLGPGPRAAVEAALFHVPAGEYRLSVFDPRTYAGARGDLVVDRETWVVMEFAPGSTRATLRSYDYPPHQAVGGWQPLVAVPD